MVRNKRKQPNEQGEEGNEEGNEGRDEEEPTMHGSPTGIPEPLPEQLKERNEFTKSRLTENPSLEGVRPDGGYLDKAWRRQLHEGKWYYVLEEDETIPEKTKRYERPPKEAPQDLQLDTYDDETIFVDKEATVQIVDFHMDDPSPPVWEPPFTDFQHPDKLQRFLAVPIASRSWRWIHCQGLHGPTLRAIAKGTEWPYRKFGGIFSWTRASMEWADNVIRLHFQNQGGRLFIWHGGGKYAVFITCTPLDHNESTMTRIYDFVDRGCSRPEVVLRLDRSLMFYGIVRAVVQDLRFSTYHLQNIMQHAFERGIQRPTRSNLAFFYHLQDRLCILGLDAISLKSAAVNLYHAAEKIQAAKAAHKGGLLLENGPGYSGHNLRYENHTSDDHQEKEELISEGTRVLLKDQLGLINLLNNELPYISDRTQAIVDLAFNTLSFRTNTLLQWLAVITIASLPMSVVTGILGINVFDQSVLSWEKLGIVLGTIGGVILLCLVIFVIWILKDPREDKDDGANLSEQAQQAQQKALKGQKPKKQTPKQRYDYARSEDIQRDNQIIFERNASHHPMARKPSMLASPGPVNATVIKPPSPPPSKRRSTMRRTTVLPMHRESIHETE